MTQTLDTGFTPVITGEDLPESVMHLIASATPSPPDEVDVDKLELVRAILGSVIGLVDKAAVLASLSSRNQPEIDKLMRTFRWERVRWSGAVIPDGVWPILCKESAQNWIAAMVLADHYATTRFFSASEEQAHLRQMLRRKYAGARKHWAEEALRVDSPLVQHVYQHFQDSPVECEVPHAI